MEDFLSGFMNLSFQNCTFFLGEDNFVSLLDRHKQPGWLHLCVCEDECKYVTKLINILSVAQGYLG